MHKILNPLVRRSHVCTSRRKHDKGFFEVAIGTNMKAEAIRVMLGTGGGGANDDFTGS